MNGIFVTRPTLPEYNEYIEEIKTIWDKRWLTNMGEKHQILEEQLKEYLGVKNLALCVNGHMALELALNALDLSGEVITTPFTFVSTTHAIVRTGLKPVFCDITEDTYTMDVSKMEALITEKTTAIVPVHVYGNFCKVDEIQKIADKYNLKVIYDAAHAFGVKKENVGIGNYGDAVMWSFHATKMFNSIEGGAISFRDDKLYKKACLLRDYGINANDDVEFVGTNGKMNEFQAAMGICNLRHIQTALEERKRIIDYYVSNLSNIRGIVLPAKQEKIESNYAYFPILVDEEHYGINRDILCKNLAENGIFARKYFYPITNKMLCYQKEYGKANVPIAEKLSTEVMTLPLYTGLHFKDIDRICEIIRGNCKND